MPDEPRPKVFEELRVTINLGDYSNIKFAFGCEVYARDESEQAMRVAERRAFKLCEETIDKRVRALNKLADEMKK